MIGREDSMETGIVVVFVFAGGLIAFLSSLRVDPPSGSETFCFGLQGFLGALGERLFESNWRLTSTTRRSNPEKKMRSLGGEKRGRVRAERERVSRSVIGKGGRQGEKCYAMGC